MWTTFTAALCLSCIMSIHQIQVLGQSPGPKTPSGSSSSSPSSSSGSSSSSSSRCGSSISSIHQPYFALLNRKRRPYGYAFNVLGKADGPPYSAPLVSPSTLNRRKGSYSHQNPIQYETRTIYDFQTRDSRLGFIRKIYAVSSPPLSHLNVLIA